MLSAPSPCRSTVHAQYDHGRCGRGRYSSGWRKSPTMPSRTRSSPAEAAFSDGIGIEQHSRQIHQQHPHRIGEVVHDEAGTADNEHPTQHQEAQVTTHVTGDTYPFCRPQATQMALRIIQQVMMIASSCRVCGMPNNHCIHSVTSGVARPRLVPIAKIKATR